MYLGMEFPLPFEALPRHGALGYYGQLNLYCLNVWRAEALDPGFYARREYGRKALLTTAGIGLPFAGLVGDLLYYAWGPVAAGLSSLAALIVCAELVFRKLMPEAAVTVGVHFRCKGRAGVAERGYDLRFLDVFCPDENYAEVFRRMNASSVLSAGEAANLDARFDWWGYVRDAEF